MRRRRGGTTRGQRRLIGADWRPRCVLSATGGRDPPSTRSSSPCRPLSRLRWPSSPRRGGAAVPDADRRCFRCRAPYQACSHRKAAARVADEVRHAIGESLCDGARPSAPCQAAGASVRTLQRRRASTAPSSHLLDEGATTSRSATWPQEGTYRVAFSRANPLSAFGRAFRRWTARPARAPSGCRRPAFLGGVGRDAATCYTRGAP